MLMQSRYGVLPAFAAVLLLGACSTAQYGKPVNDFAAATSEAEAALSQLDTQLAQAYGALLERRVLGGEAHVRLKSNECQTRSVAVASS